MAVASRTPGLVPRSIVANVSTFDHGETPAHAPLDHALNIDFVNEGSGPGARVAVELSAESGRELVRAILAALRRGGEEHPALSVE